MVYAAYEDTMEEEHEEMMGSDVVRKYANLVIYLANLYEIRESWALSYRKLLQIRGNNTNNPVESQFLVLKDEVLNRTKEININRLFEKITNECTNHYKIKLLNVASGKFDDCYSSRFKGLKKKMGDGIGFTMPSLVEQKKTVEDTVMIGESLFKMPSTTTVGVTYTVDMKIGICDCYVGHNGDVCKHQYILWAFGKAASSNFFTLP